MRMYFILLFLIFSFFVIPTTVSAAPCTDCAGPQQIEELFANIISAAVGLGFIALFVMLIVAGVKYLTSGGDQKAVASAHQTATWAIMGVLLLAVSWITLQLVEQFTGVPVTIFNIKKLF